MNDNGREQEEPTVEELVERYREMKRQGAELVDAMFREAVQRRREEEERTGALLERLHREAFERACLQPQPTQQAPRGVHYSELREAQPGEPFADEWNTYRREVGRWLAEGLEGRHVLIKGEQILGIYQTSEEAEAVGWYRYGPHSYFVHPIRTEEPYLRIRGVNYPWPVSRLR